MDKLKNYIWQKKRKRSRNLNSKNIKLYYKPQLNNISDFIDWCDDVSVISKCNLRNLENYMHFYFAYGTYLSATAQDDTNELRKQWYLNHKGKIVEVSLDKSGF
jgi:hypothetical protein